jgi:hypothetical protein
VRWGNGAYWLVSLGVMTLLTLLLAFPTTAGMLHMVRPPFEALGPALLLAGAAVLWYELPKLVGSRS